jgi:hypothetical protein
MVARRETTRSRRSGSIPLAATTHYLATCCFATLFEDDVMEKHIFSVAQDLIRLCSRHRINGRALVLEVRLQSGDLVQIPDFQNAFVNLYEGKPNSVVGKMVLREIPKVQVL